MVTRLVDNWGEHCAFLMYINESTAGADASVEVPKLHNIKLLIASFYTHIDYNYHDKHF